MILFYYISAHLFSMSTDVMERLCWNSLDAIFYVLFEERNELWSFRIKKMNNVILILMVIFLPCNTTQVILLILPISRLKKKLLNYCL